MESLKDSWYPSDLALLQGTLERFFSQRQLAHPGMVNVEYYIATDIEDKPFAMTGIYSNDLEGGAGFATRDKLDPDSHNFITGLGWFAVGKEYQGSGVGGFLFDWVEHMAQERGVRVHFIETDDSSNEEPALRLYERKGYGPGFDVDNFYGLGRHRRAYYSYRAEDSQVEQFSPNEQITSENKKEILALGRRLYSPERYQEFQACIDLLLEQREGEGDLIRKPDSFVLRGGDGAVEGFAVVSKALYDNGVICDWYGADPKRGDGEKLFQAVQGYTAGLGREVTVLFREGDDADAIANGFRSPDAEGGIPFIFGKGDATRYLFYTKGL